MKQVLHKRSNETQSGGPKIPSASTLEYGEIAVNYHDGVEKLFIKNDSNKVKTIRTDNQLPPVEKHEDQEFVYRKAVNENEAQSLRFDRIYGKTLAWNQQCDTINKTVYSRNGIQVVNNNDGSLTINGTINVNWSDEVLCSQCFFDTIEGHKYYMRSTLESGTCSAGVRVGNGYFYVGINSSTVGEAQKNTTRHMFMQTSSGDTYTNVKIRVILIDLTLMYGSGNEPSTKGEFESMFPENYYDYCEGKLISNDAKTIKTSNNLWDGRVSCVHAYLEDDGSIHAASYHYISCYIPIEEGKTYRLCNNGKSLGNMASICFYNSNRTYVGGQRYAESSSFQVVAPENSKYCRFTMCPTPLDYDGFLLKIDDGVIENKIINNTVQLNLGAIQVKSHNIWDEDWEEGTIWIDNGTNKTESGYIRSRNFIEVGELKTYCIAVPNSGARIFFYDKNKTFLSVTGYLNGQFVTPENTEYIRFFANNDYGGTYLNNICINVSGVFDGRYEPHGILTIEGGLKGAGSVKDEIVGNKYIKRVGSVDLGTLSWRYSSGGIFYAPVPGGKGISIACMYQAAIEDKYAYSAAEWSLLPDKCFGFGEQVAGGNYGSVYINDSAYSDTATFKTAMNGVMLYYELLTPIEYELVNPIHTVVKSGTTECRISPNPDGLSAPMVADISYTQTSEYILGELDSKLGDIETLLETI